MASPDREVAGAEWYVVSDHGDSALRITPGLQIGETDEGYLTLNDPDPRHCWIAFDLDAGRPSVEVVDSQHLLVLDGGRGTGRERLLSGSRLVLPNNTLYISRDFAVPRHDGPALEVLAAGDLPRPGTAAAGPMETAVSDTAPASPARSAAVPEPAGDPGGPARNPGGGLGMDELSAIAARAAVRAERSAAPPRRSTTSQRAGSALRDLLPEPARAAPASPSPEKRGTAAAHARPAGVKRAARRRPRGHGRGRRASPRWLVAAAVVAVGVAVAVVRSPSHPLVREMSLAADEAVADAGELFAWARTLAAEAPAPESASPDAPSAADPGEAGGTAATTPDPEPRQGAMAAARAAGGAPEAGSSEGGAETSANATANAPAAPVPGEPERPSQQAATPAAPADWRIERAREALEQGRITYPPGNNAVALLDDLLEERPGHPVAMAMLGECTARLIDAAVQAHQAGLDYEARNTLEEVLGFNPDSARARQLWREWVGTRR